MCQNPFFRLTFTPNKQTPEHAIVLRGLLYSTLPIIYKKGPIMANISYAEGVIIFSAPNEATLDAVVEVFNTASHFGYDTTFNPDDIQVSLGDNVGIPERGRRRYQGLPRAHSQTSAPVTAHYSNTPGTSRARGIVFVQSYSSASSP